eukprot:jgi/Mesen1/11001/ME000097S10580
MVSGTGSARPLGMEPPGSQGQSLLDGNPGPPQVGATLAGVSIIAQANLMRNLNLPSVRARVVNLQVHDRTHACHAADTTRLPMGCCAMASLSATTAAADIAAAAASAASPGGGHQSGKRHGDQVISNARHSYSVGGRQAPANQGPPVDRPQVAWLAEQEKLLLAAVLSGEVGSV